jgi:hypothetical protein
MTRESFVNLNIKLGHNIINVNNYSWLRREDNTAISIPSLEVIFPGKTEFKFLFSTGIRSISFKTDIQTKNSFEYIFSGSDYSLGMFHSKTRNQIRKGLKSCVFKRPILSDLIDTGYEINCSTLSRQKRNVSYLDDKNLWSKYISILYYTDDVNILGAYYETTLVAYTLFIKVGTIYYIYHPFVNNDYSVFCPMNGLLFTFINEIISREKEISVSYGLASLQDKPGLDKFKKAMLFEEIPVSRIIVFHPFYGLFINKVGSFILGLSNKFIKNTFSEKYLLMVNFKALTREYQNSLNDSFSPF